MALDYGMIPWGTARPFWRGADNAIKPLLENKATSPRSALALRMLTVLALTMLGFGSLPTPACSQSRGSMQVTATAVAPSASIAGVQASQRAVAGWTVERTVSNDVATLAQVAVDRSGPAAGSANGTLGVEVDFLKT
jgi:hypothetical protein